MQALFLEDPRFEIVATGSSAGDAERIASESNPEILILDLSMPGDVYGAIRLIARRQSKINIIVFTAYANIDFAVKALDAGARGYVLKGRPVDDLYDAIGAVGSGKTFVSPGFAEKLLEHIPGVRSPDDRRRGQLSHREKQIVEYLLDGKTNRQIATDLNLSEKTIKHYMTNLMIKLKVKNRVEVVLAVQSQLRQPFAGVPESSDGLDRAPAEP